MKPFFKAEDFYLADHDNNPCNISRFYAAGKANRLLQERGLKVYSPNYHAWYNLDGPLVTHRALLINIDGKQCEHFATEVTVSSGMPGEFASQSGFKNLVGVCKDCGIKLKATWSPVE